MNKHRLSTIVLTLALLLSSGAGIATASNSLAQPHSNAAPQQPRACVTPPANMVAWYPFDEAAGPTAFDITVNANNGNWLTPLSVIAGKVANAIYFLGGYVEATNSPSLNFGTGNFAMDGWIRLLQSSGPQGVVDKRSFGSGTNYRGYALVRAGNQLRFEFSDGSGTVWGATTPAIPALTNGLWHFIAVTVDRSSSTGLNIYVDNVLVATANATGANTITNAANLWIGKSHKTGEGTFLESGLDELELFDRDLSASEIATLFQADSEGKCKQQGQPTVTATATPRQQVTLTPTCPAGTVCNSPTPTNTVCADPVGNPCDTATSTATQPQATATATATITRIPTGTGTSTATATQPQATATSTAISTPTATATHECCQPYSLNLTAGIADNFTLPTEPASPSTNLANFIAPAPLRPFDDPSANSGFGHTFTGLAPLNDTHICSATLTIRLKATQDIPTNDGIALGFTPPGGSGFAWTHYIGSGNSSPGLIGTPWTVGSPAVTFNLNLAALPVGTSGSFNLLAQIASNGYLDVLVRDDTMVDFVSLSVNYCCDCTPHVTTTRAGIADQFAAPLETAVPGPGLYTYMSSHGFLPGLKFDEQAPNRVFGHTFANLRPLDNSTICTATLEIRVKAQQGGSGNDAIYLGVAPSGSNPWTWGHHFGNPGGLGAPFPAIWSPGTAPVTYLFDLNNLPTPGGPVSLISLLNSNGYLDMLMQDDTAIDYMILTVGYCCPPANGTPVPSVTATVGPRPTRTVAPTNTPCRVPWIDISNSVFQPYITRLGCLGVVNGTSATTFSPNNNVTRGQLAKISTGALGLLSGGLSEVGEQSFADVPTSSIFYQYIEAAALYDVISGYPCGGPGEPCDEQARPYFRPNANATRGQLAKIIVQAGDFNDDPIAEDQQSFADVPSSSLFYRYIEIAYGRGIVGGFPCGGPGEPCDAQALPYFRPNATATRGQLTKLVDIAMSEQGLPPHGPSAANRVR